MENKLIYISDTEFQEALDTSSSYRQLLRKFDLSTNGTSYELLKREIKRRNLNTENFEILKKTNRVINNYTQEEIFSKNSPVSNIKKYIKRFGLKDIDKCENCKITEWMGQKLSMQVHHVDGDHYNNEPSNLQVLCPNCHSLTENFGSKNNKGKTFFQKNKDKKCIDCENPVYGNNIRCSKCHLIWYQKIGEKLKRDNLNKYIFNFVSIEEIQKETEANEEEIISQFKKFNLWEKYNQAIELNAEERENKLKDLEKRKNYVYINKMEDNKKQEIRKKLKEKIRTQSFCSIGKEYNLTDNAIRKWCKNLGLPDKKKIIDAMTDEEWNNL